MQLKFLFILKLVLGLIIANVEASYESGKGRFESYNENRYTEAKSIDDNDSKFFLNRNRERMPPAHDTVC